MDELDQLIREAGPEARPALVVALAARLAALGAALVPQHGGTNAVEAPDENLAVEEAAKRTGMSVSYLYKNAKRLPFAGKVGRRTLFSARGLERWRAARMRA